MTAPWLRAPAFGRTGCSWPLFAGTGYWVPGPAPVAAAEMRHAADGTILTVTAHRDAQVRYTDLHRVLADACDRVHGTVNRTSGPATSPASATPPP